jgi:phosphate transport system protein
MLWSVREIFHGELERLGADLAVMCGLVCKAMERATEALRDTDLALAEQVISSDADIEALAERCAEHASALLALQAPVARDLRAVVTAIQASEKLARMGNLARHVAEVVRLRHPRPTAPAEILEKLVQMGQLASAAGRRVGDAIAAPSDVLAAYQERADDETDQLQSEVLDLVTSADPAYPVQVGVDVALLARFFERFADQAVTIARRLDFVVTGERHQGQRATPPRG